MINRILQIGEFGFGFLQGKGWGAGTTEKEVRSIAKKIGELSEPLVIDAGGNLGTWTDSALSTWPGCEVHIFEPAQSNHDSLQERFSGNSNVFINKQGLAGETGKGTLFADSAGSGLGSLSKRRLDHFNLTFEHSEEVGLLKFDDYWKKYLKKRPVDIFKLDIEGHELEALSGSIEALNTTKVIQFEFGGANIDTRTYFQDFWYLLKPMGFNFFRISPFGLQQVSSYSERHEIFITTNFLAVRD